MNPLKLSPLPISQNEENSTPSAKRMDGFVDESVILALMTGPTSPRSHADQQDLALSADDNDFAGWHFDAPSPFRGMETLPAPQFQESAWEPEPDLAPRAPLFPRRVTAPAVEPGLGIPHVGVHRWWVAGLGVAMCTLLLSYLLMTLAHRPMPATAEEFNLPAIQQSYPAAGGPPPAAPAPVVEMTASGMTR